MPDFRLLYNKIKDWFAGDFRTANLTKNVLGSLCIRSVSILTSFLMVPITIDYVSPDIYGVWLTLSSIIIWISYFDMGFSHGLKNKLTEALAYGDMVKAQGLVSTTYFLMTAIFVPLCAILLIAIPLVDWCNLLNVNPAYSDSVCISLRIITAVCCIQFILNALVSVVSAYQKVAFSTSFSVIGNLLALFSILIIRNYCESSLVLFSVIMSVAPVIVLFISSIVLYSTSFKSVAPRLTAAKRKYVPELFTLGYKFFIINIQVLVVYQSTNFLISIVSSPTDVTNYNLASRYLTVGVMVFQMILSPLWPAYTDAYARNDTRWMKSTYKKMTKILYLCILGSLVLVLLSQPFYHFWVGNSVEIPLKMTLAVAIYVCLYCYMNLNSTIVVGIGKIRIHTFLALAGMSLHIPLSFLLSKTMGCYGVLASMIIINLVYAVIFRIQAGKLIEGTARGLWNMA